MSNNLVQFTIELNDAERKLAGALKRKYGGSIETVLHTGLYALARMDGVPEDAIVEIRANRLVEKEEQPSKSVRQRRTRTAKKSSGQTQGAETKPEPTDEVPESV